MQQRQGAQTQRGQARAEEQGGDRRQQKTVPAENENPNIFHCTIYFCSCTRVSPCAAWSTHGTNVTGMFDARQVPNTDQLAICHLGHNVSVELSCSHSWLDGEARQCQQKLHEIMSTCKIPLRLATDTPPLVSWTKLLERSNNHGACFVQKLERSIHVHVQKLDQTLARRPRSGSSIEGYDKWAV